MPDQNGDRKHDGHWSGNTRSRDSDASHVFLKGLATAIMVAWHRYSHLIEAYRYNTNVAVLRPLNQSFPKQYKLHVQMYQFWSHIIQAYRYKTNYNCNSRSIQVSLMGYKLKHLLSQIKNINAFYSLQMRATFLEWSSSIQIINPIYLIHDILFVQKTTTCTIKMLYT